MRSRLKPRSIYDVFAVIGCLAALSTGTAYAANTVFSTDIVDGEVKNADIAGNSITSNRIYPGSVTNTDIGADAVDGSKVLNGELTGADVSNSSLTGDDVANSTLTGIDVSNGSLTSSDVLDESLTGADVAASSLTGADVASSSLTGADIANRSVDADDLDAADRSGSIDVGAIANGRCTTITGSVTGAEPGDVAVITTNGSLPNGMTISAQRALTDAIHIKVCNLTGATSAAITDLPVRVLTIH
jgi:uncharacterized protein YjbI with pentapeptide repeats